MTLRAVIEIEIAEQPWANECSIDQVMAQSKGAALDKLRGVDWPKGVTYKAPEIVDILLIEAT